MSEPTTSQDVQRGAERNPEDFFASHPSPTVVAPQGGPPDVREITDPMNMTPEAQQVAAAQNPQVVAPPGQQQPQAVPPQQPQRPEYPQPSEQAIRDVREMRRKADMLDQLVGDPGANEVLNRYYDSQKRQSAGLDLEDVPDRPELPEKPRNYSRAEALADPDSDSAQYDNQFADYQFQLSQWMADSHEIRQRNEDRQRAYQYNLQQEQAARYQQQQQQQQAAYQRQQQQQQIINSLRDKYSLNDDQIKDFVQYTQQLNNSNSVEPWIEAWSKARNQPIQTPQLTYAQQQNVWQPNAAPNPAVAQPAAPFPFQQQQPQFPRTAAGSSSEQPPASDNFLHNLMGDIARRDSAMTNFVADRTP